MGLGCVAQMISHGLFVRNRADIALVAQIVANASTAAALKTEDDGVDVEASPAGPSPRLGFLSRTLGDSMVLQSAPATALVWGNTSAHATVTTTFGATTLHTTAGADGIWRQRLPRQPPAQSHTRCTSSRRRGSLHRKRN